ncbi:MAG: ABC transporter permease [Candidatus Aureabacteria bacterium]|nr:ABC transporter permease [Candidatus Auribacterota bacterium]
MKTTWTIAKKEFSLYFYTPVAYVLAAVFYIINGLLFYFLLNAANRPEVQVEGSIMQYIFGDIFFWITLFILVPVLTMRLISEERREGTLELLLTFPLNDFQLITGKFFGAFFFYFFLWIPTFIYVGILFLFQPPDIGPILSAFLGVLLVGAMFIAIGLFSSTLSENQIISAMVSFGIILGLFLVSAIETLLPPGIMRFVLQYLNFIRHLDLFKIGIIDTRHIVYFLSFILFFLFLSIRSLESRRWTR